MVAGKTSTVYKFTLLAFFCLFLASAVQAQVINSVTTTNVNCFGGNDGEITVNVTGPGPYTYRLRYDFGDGSFNDLGIVSGAASNTITFRKGNGTLFDDAVGIPANVPPLESYVITVFFNCGGVGCIRSVSRTITEPTELIANIDDLDPDCDASATGNGQIDISVSGGTTPYNIVWSGPTPVPNGTLSTAANLNAGNYTITITDAKSCVQVLNAVVPVTTPADAGTGGQVCGTTPSFTLNGNAPAVGEIGTWTGPAGVTFSPDANTRNAVANNLNVGSNTLRWTITDAGFVCPGSFDEIIVTYSNIDMTGSAPVMLPCFGATSGTGTFTVAGGSSPFTYSLLSNTAGATITVPGTPVATTSIGFTNAGAGQVQLQVTDATGCTDNVTIVISQPTQVTGTPVVTNVTCNGSSTGSIQITPAGGTGPDYDFSIDNGVSYPITNATTHTFTGLAQGTYNIKVRDNNGCESATIPVTITQPTAVVPNATPTAVTCFGGNDGSIAITPTGGVGPYDFSIDGGTSYAISNATTHTFTGLTALSYNIRVRDANNCETAVTPIVVGQPIAAVTAATTPTDVACFGASTGSILVTPSGGTGPYDFSIDGGASYAVFDATTHTFTGLVANTYNIRVRDAANCESAVIPVTVSQPIAGVTATTTPTNVLCFGGATGSILVTPSGGTGPYDFSIDGGASYPVAGATTHTFNGLIALSYNIRVRDANGCETAVLPVVITEPSAAVSGTTTPTNVTCFNGSDGSIFVTPSGGVSPYDFSSDGGTTYPISGTTGLFAGLTAQSYNIRVRDANGCESNLIVTNVSQPADITFTPSVVDATCFNGADGSISITPAGGTGPYDFSIDGGASYPVAGATTHTFNGLTAQSYNLRVRDANGCESAVFVQAVNAASPVTIDATSSVPATCAGINDGSISVTTVSGGTGPYQYSSNNGASFQTASTFSGLAAGDYDVVVMDANSCASAPVTVTVGSGLVYDVSATSTPAACSGVNDGTVTVNSTTGGIAPFQYSIDGGALQASPTFTALSVGNHTVTATDANGCVSNAFVVAVGSGVTISSTNTPSAVTVCLGTDGSINVTGISGGVGPYDISIDNGLTYPVLDVTSNTFTGLAAGDYTVLIRDNVGCSSTPALVTVAAPPGCVLNCLAFNVVTDVTQTQRPTCNGGSDGVIALTISGPPGNYIVELIPSTAPPVILPSGSTFVFSNLSENAYQYAITDGTNVCVKDFQWDAVQNIVANVLGTEGAACFGTPSGSAVIDATGSATNDYFYSVDGTAWTEFVPGIEITGLPAGTYNIRIGGAANDPCYSEVGVVINELGTAELDTAYVSPVAGFPSVSFPETPTASRVIGLERSADLATYEIQLELVDPYGVPPNPPFITDWEPVTGINPQSSLPEQQFNNLHAGEYVLRVRDDIGCERAFTFFIEVDPRIFIPNIFTPNKDDEINKNFFIRNLPESGSILSVTDRWGKQVYSTKNYNYNNLWDGGDSPDGVYYYRLQIKGGKTYTGWVEILRGSKP